MKDYVNIKAYQFKSFVPKFIQCILKLFLVKRTYLQESPPQHINCKCVITPIWKGFDL